MKNLIPSFILLLTYFATSAQTQIINTIAGTGVPINTGDGGPATWADVKAPRGIDVDVQGNVYFVAGATIRKIDTLGIITTVAGNGTIAHTGDGGLATSASLFFPEDVAVDVAGNLYIVESVGNSVRKVNTAGIITTIAGTGSYGFSGDGGPATAAKLYYPVSIAVDGEGGNIYIADRYNYRVRKINSFGIISTVAGAGAGIGFGGDGGPATAAFIGAIWGICLDHSNNLYITYSDRVRKVNLATDTITLFAGGTGFPGGFAGDGGPATAAVFYCITDVAADLYGNVYIADGNENRVRKVDPSGIITTIAGNGYMPGPGTGGFSGDHCLATDAEMFKPWGIVVDAKQDVYISEIDNHRVRKLTANNKPVFTGGHNQNISSCDSVLILDTLLSVTDADTMQSEVWSVLVPPLHGTLMASSTIVSSTGVMTPTGMIYILAPGYSGADSFSVLVTDCGYKKDTAKIRVSIATSGPAPASISGPSTVCIGDSIALVGSTVGGTWSSSSAAVSISPSGMISGVSGGVATLTYTITNPCGSATTNCTVNVIDCPLRLQPGLERKFEISAWPNPVSSAMIKIEFLSGAREKAHITIANVMGVTVQEFTLQSNNPADIDFNVPPGVYIISGITENGMQVGKIKMIKE